MTDERYDQLQNGPDPQHLTDEELEAGWHWCPEMDYLLCLRGGDDCFCGTKRKETCDSEDVS
jgi:hypothetical protein